MWALRYVYRHTCTDLCEPHACEMTDTRTSCEHVHEPSRRWLRLNDEVYEYTLFICLWHESASSLRKMLTSEPNSDVMHFCVVIYVMIASVTCFVTGQFELGESKWVRACVRAWKYNLQWCRKMLGFGRWVGNHSNSMTVNDAPMEKKRSEFSHAHTCIPGDSITTYMLLSVLNDIFLLLSIFFVDDDDCCCCCFYYC